MFLIFTFLHFLYINIKLLNVTTKSSTSVQMKLPNDQRMQPYELFIPQMHAGKSGNRTSKLCFSVYVYLNLHKKCINPTHLLCMLGRLYTVRRSASRCIMYAPKREKNFRIVHNFWVIFHFLSKNHVFF